MCCKSAGKVFTFLFVVIALAFAVLVSFAHQQALVYVVMVTRFFDSMIPVLAVGALLKYLVFHWHGNHEESCSK